MHEPGKSPSYIFPPEIFYSASSAIEFCMGIMQQFDFQSKFLLAFKPLKSEFLVMYKNIGGTSKEIHYFSGHIKK
jgi:hypothetical protein